MKGSNVLCKSSCFLLVVLICLMPIILCCCESTENIYYCNTHNLGWVYNPVLFNFDLSVDDDFYLELQNVLPKNALESFSQNFSTLSKQFDIIPKDIYNVKALRKKNIVWVCDNPTDYEYPIIVSKWFYYHYLLLDKQNSEKFGLKVKIGYECYEPLVKILNESRYCMEQVYLFPPLLRNDDLYKLGEVKYTKKDSQTVEHKIPYGVPVMYTTGDYSELARDILAKDFLTASSPQYRTLYPDLLAAALSRYGFVNFDDFEKKPVPFAQSPYLVTIVGYVESEADKLLSTGVTMDSNNSDYQIVAEQLKSPKIYTLHEDFPLKLSLVK